MTCLSRLTDLPENDPQIPNDFDKRYQHTYLCLTENGVRRAVYYAGRDGGIYHFKDIDNNVNILYDGRRNIPDLDLSLLLPAVGYYNVAGTPTYLYKVPQKQWKRSFCSSAYSTPMANGLRNRTEVDRYWQAIAKEVINPTYAKLDEVTRKLFSFVALTPKFALQQSETGRVQLLYRQYVVATLHFKAREVRVLQPVLRQEVMDFFKYTGVSTWTLK